MKPAAMTAAVAAPSPVAVRKLRMGQRMTLRSTMIVVWRSRAPSSAGRASAAEHRRGRGLHRDGGGQARGHERGARAPPASWSAARISPDMA
jgi:hypothetical protein